MHAEVGENVLMFAIYFEMLKNKMNERLERWR